MKKWIYLFKRTGGNKLHDDEIIDIILENRGLVNKEEKKGFLEPELQDIDFKNLGIDPREIEKAIGRIKKAISQKESIIVYTDYDADGVCGGAIVWEALYSLGASVLPYIPDRVKEGYGLSKFGIESVKKKFNTDLIITVDHGITANDKVNYANKLGIETIILDHHSKPKKVPRATAIIHTTQLSAGALSLVFVDHLLNKLKAKKEKYHYFKKNLDLAAISTIADMIPLKGPNRIIVKHGLDRINNTSRIGLTALIGSTGLMQRNIGTYEVGRVLAPRINAMGRITHAIDALRLLCTKDTNRAKCLADKLRDVNKQRQLLTDDIYNEAIKEVRELFISSNGKIDKLIFISSKTYNEGIIGLVAGKLVDAFYRPVVVVSVGEEYSKGSARSVVGFNIIEKIRKTSYLLEDAGGHPMAAGFSLKTKNLKELKNRLINLTNKELTDEYLTKTLTVDLELNIDEISQILYRKITKLEPFGIGNPIPVFSSKNIKIISTRKVGKDGKHLKLSLVQADKGQIYNQIGRNDHIVDAIGFGMGDLYDKMLSNQIVDLAYTLNENIWNNRKILQLKLIDVKILT